MWIAAGGVERLYVHAPERLARQYAYHVLRMDEFQRAGVEVIFLHREPPHRDLSAQAEPQAGGDAVARCVGPLSF